MDLVFKFFGVGGVGWGGGLKIFAWPVSAVFAFHILFASISYFFVFFFPHVSCVYIISCLYFILFKWVWCLILVFKVD